MIETADFVQEKKNKNLEWIHSENIYSHDSMFFGEIPENESWSFCDTQEISLTSLAFLCMRSLLSQELYSKKIKVTQMSQISKAKLGKSGYTNYFNEFLESESPVLGITNKKEIPSFYTDLFTEKHFFHFDSEDKKTKIVTGGGIFQEKKTNANEMIEKLIQEFNLREKTGHLFLRTKLNSYLYLLNPENKSKTFYIQQKNSFAVDFLFYHIKLDL